VRVDDVQQDERWYQGLDTVTGVKTRSLLSVPMKHHDKVTGVIDIIDAQIGAFTDEDLNLLEAIASIAAVALENARLYASMRSYADRMVLLHQIGQALSATLDFSTVVHVALNQIRRIFLPQSVALLRADPETNELYFEQVLVDVKLVEIPLRLQAGEGLAGWALEQREIVLVKDAQTDPRFSDRADRYLDIQTHALMAVPLLTRDSTLGVIEVSSGEPGTYTNDELNTLQAIASTLAVALENAYLYEELKTALREREQAQAQLVRSEKMAALGRLTASLAHEINNPLQALRSGFHLLLNPKANAEKQQQYLQVANREVERLITIVERVLGFYRPTSDQIEPMMINTVLDETLLLVGKKLEHSGIKVQRRFAAHLPKVDGVSNQLKQVFLNIILNAQQAMPKGGELTVETGVNKSEVRISFQDTGAGIPADQITHLFEPFFTTRLDGTGLGLTISYSIVERHNGRIEVESQVGHGSTFTVALPASREQAGKVKTSKDHSAEAGE